LFIKFPTKAEVSLTCFVSNQTILCL